MPPSKKTYRISRICFDSQPRRFHFTICHLIGWVNWLSTGCQMCKFWGRLNPGRRFLAAKPLVDAASPRLSRFSPHFTGSCTTRFGPSFPPTKTASYAGYVTRTSRVQKTRPRTITCGPKSYLSAHRDPKKKKKRI